MDIPFDVDIFRQKARERKLQEHEALALCDEVARLQSWKAEATHVIEKWEQVWTAAGEPGRLGESLAEATLRRVERLRSHADAALVVECDHPHLVDELNHALEGVVLLRRLATSLSLNARGGIRQILRILDEVDAYFTDDEAVAAAQPPSGGTAA